MTKQTAKISWVGCIKYPDLEEVYAGTLVLEASTPKKEVKEAFRKHILQFIPDGFEIKEMLRGRVWFVPSEPNGEGE